MKNHSLVHNITELQAAYDIARKENKPKVMDMYIQDPQDWQWMYENSEGKFKWHAFKRAASDLRSWGDIFWVLEEAFYWCQKTITTKLDKLFFALQKFFDGLFEK